MPYFLDGNNLMRRPGATADRAALGALSLRFARGVSADDAIVAAISRSPAPSDVIVVTADRELVRRARDAGANTLDPEAFWARFGTGPAPDDPNERVDVGEWMRYFADDRNRR